MEEWWHWLPKAGVGINSKAKAWPSTLSLLCDTVLPRLNVRMKCGYVEETHGDWQLPECLAWSTLEKNNITHTHAAHSVPSLANQKWYLSIGNIWRTTQSAHSMMRLEVGSRAERSWRIRPWGKEEEALPVNYSGQCSTRSSLNPFNFAKVTPSPWCEAAEPENRGHNFVNEPILTILF